MKFSYDHAQRYAVSDYLEIVEYCSPKERLQVPLDGAVGYFKKGSFGPKVNTGFTELFFVLDGCLTIEIDTSVLHLKKEDMFIVPEGKVHTLHGDSARLFISCTPPFSPEKVSFL